MAEMYCLRRGLEDGGRYRVALDDQEMGRYVALAWTTQRRRKIIQVGDKLGAVVGGSHRYSLYEKGSGEAPASKWHCPGAGGGLLHGAGRTATSILRAVNNYCSVYALAMCDLFHPTS